MGWSVEAAEPQIAAMFRKLKMRYRITHPESPHPTVNIMFDGDELDIEVMQKMQDLFPDSVYVKFIPGYTISDVKK